MRAGAAGGARSSAARTPAGGGGALQGRPQIAYIGGAATARMEHAGGSAIRLTIKTVEGDCGEFSMERFAAVEGATRAAMVRFRIEPSEDASYRLALKSPDGEFAPLDPSKTLLGEGVKDGDELWVGTEQAVG